MAEDQIGFVMSVAGVAGLLAQTPAGALTDICTAKRTIIAIACVVVTSSAIALPFLASSP